MKRVLLLLSLVCIKQIHAQTWVVIPDANFVLYLQSIIPSAMHGDSLNTSSTLVTTTTHSINVYNKSISNLNGIQYFNSLTYLDCKSNSFTSLPTLPNVLKYLNCSNNFSLVSLPSLPNSLTYLNCSAWWCNSINCCGGGSGPPPLAGILNCLPVLPSSLDTLICCYNNITCFPTFPNSLLYLSIENPYSCLPNYVLPAMNSYTTVPLCTTSNPNGCTTIANGNACGITGINQYKTNSNVTVYPNPTSNEFIIDANTSDKLNVYLYDINGRCVLTQSIEPTPSPSKEGSSNRIDVGSLNEGVYTLTIKTTSSVVNKKLVIVR